jgi:DNA mismatch repair protein MSH2
VASHFGRLFCRVDVNIGYQLTSNEANFGQFTLARLDMSRYMRLDAAALRALNILPLPGDGESFMTVIIVVCSLHMRTPVADEKSSTVLGLLDHCRTAQGSRLLRQWLLRPLRDAAAISALKRNRTSSF